MANSGPSESVLQWSLQTAFLSDDERLHFDPSSGEETWLRTNLLGQGGFGEVWRETCTSGARANQVRAVKQIRKSPQVMAHLGRELEVLVTFSTEANDPEHLQYFVQFLGWFGDDLHLYIALEFVPFGDLQQHISQKPLSEEETAVVVSQIAKALRCMHRLGFVHRDLKPANILVASPRPSWLVKVTDFGTTKNVEGTQLRTRIGTESYMAPELFDESLAPTKEYTSAVDIWALGAVAYCARTGKGPFASISELFSFSTGKTRFPLTPLISSSGAFMDFILNLMDKIPANRLTIDQVLEQEWLKSGGNVAKVAHQTVLPQTNVWDAQASAAWNTSIKVPTGQTMRSSTFPRQATTQSQNTFVPYRPEQQTNSNSYPVSQTAIQAEPAAELLSSSSRQTTRRLDSGYHGNEAQEYIREEPSYAQPRAFDKSTSSASRPTTQHFDSGYHEQVTPQQSSKTVYKRSPSPTGATVGPWSQHLHEDPYRTCLTCGKWFEDRNDLFEHIEAEQHGVDTKTLKPEPYARPYKYHENTYTDDVPNESQAYSPKRESKELRLEHANKDPRQCCLTCGKYFIDRDRLFRHIAAENHGVDPRTFEAEPFEKPSPNSTHTQENSANTCLVCGESFWSRNEMFDHIWSEGHAV